MLGCQQDTQKNFLKNVVTGFPLGILLCSILFIRETVATIKNKSLNFRGLIQGSLFPCQVKYSKQRFLVIVLLSSLALSSPRALESSISS